MTLLDSSQVSDRCPLGYLFIHPTGGIRVCEIRFVSTDESEETCSDIPMPKRSNDPCVSSLLATSIPHRYYEISYMRVVANTREATRDV